jgi:hypothetical protein
MLQQPRTLSSCAQRVNHASASNTLELRAESESCSSSLEHSRAASTDVNHAPAALNTLELRAENESCSSSLGHSRAASRKINDA